MHDVTPADMPRLSIIIVSWNVRDLLIACLESVMAQEDVQLEVFVVDNASADGTVEAVRERFPDVTVIANRENVGFPRANNQVLGYARGEYILYLNPDTEVQPGTLSACVAELDAHPELGAVGSRLQFADGQVQYDGARRAFRLRHLAYDMFYLHMLFPRSRIFADHVMGDWDHRGTRDVEALCGAMIMVRRSLATELGGLPTEVFMYHEDLSFCLRICRSGYGIRYLGDVATVHHTKQSSSRSPARLRLLDAECKYRFVAEAQGAGAAAAARVLLGIRAILRMGISAGGVVLPKELKAKYPRVFDFPTYALQLAWAVAPGAVQHLVPRAPSNATAWEMYRGARHVQSGFSDARDTSGSSNTRATAVGSMGVS